MKMASRVAVIGGGISGMAAAYELAKAGVRVCLYEKDEKLGGHAKTVTVDGVHLDLAFMVFNRVNYPNMVELLESLGIEMEDTDMSFSVSLERGRGCEWGSRNSLSSLFAQKSNILNPYFWKMLHEMIKFKDEVLIYVDELESNPELDRNDTLGNFVNSRGYSKLFQEAYLIPLCGSIWSCSTQHAMTFPAFSILSFFRNHFMLQMYGRPQWLTVKGRSHRYVNKLIKELVERGCQIKTNCEVRSVSTSDQGCIVSLGDGSEEAYDECILATHAPNALDILGHQATQEERRVLGAFQYAYSDIYLHLDKSLMPQNLSAWSAWNFLGSSNSRVSITFWLNVIQNIEEHHQHFFVTVNPPEVPKNVLLKWSTGHPIPSIAATKASLEMDNIQGKRRIWFCGAYQGYGFHEDGLKAGLAVSRGMLGRNYIPLQNPKQMILSWTQTAARIFICRFLRDFISVGSLIMLEDGGRVFSFQGISERCEPKVTIKVHNPQFYSKVSTMFDLGLVDAYINGDFSLLDTKEGLLNLFKVFIVNRELKSSTSKTYGKRDCWTTKLFTSGIASAKYVYNQFTRPTTLTQAHSKNISRHHDMKTRIFSLFLDETMTYSCAIFKSIEEDLKDAQLRKLLNLITMAKIEKHHKVLDIGCGWGSLAIEVVRLTGCKYTGIALSDEQLRFAEKRVKEAGHQDHIEFLLCDYRQLPKDVHKYDRIISCEMLEDVDMEDFFCCCDSILTKNGLLLLQFMSVPDESYEEHRQIMGFLGGYIVPALYLPSLSKVTSTMAATSTLCIEQVENIGNHYYQTLRCWRQNLLEQQSNFVSLGFEEKFIRAWEYYFDYCAAGFDTNTLRNYQVVFSRLGNGVAFGNPHIALK